MAVTLMSASALLAASPVEKLLPGKDAVKGWSVLPGSLQYGKGDDLTKIYNGGYEVYTDNGVIDAARQMYQRGSDYIEVTIHTMKSDKAAADFLKYWQKQFKATVVSKNIRSANFFMTKPNVSRYFVSGKYFVTISAFHSGVKAANDSSAFMVAIDKSIRTAGAQKGTKR